MIPIHPNLKDTYTELLCYDPVKVTYADGSISFWNKKSMEIFYFENKSSAQKIDSIATLVRNGTLLYKDGKEITSIDFSIEHRRTVIKICIESNLNYSELCFFSRERLSAKLNLIKHIFFQ